MLLWFRKLLYDGSPTENLTELILLLRLGCSGWQLTVYWVFWLFTLLGNAVIIILIPLVYYSYWLRWMVSKSVLQFTIFQRTNTILVEAVEFEILSFTSSPLNCHQPSHTSCQIFWWPIFRIFSSCCPSTVTVAQPWYRQGESNRHYTSCS